MSIEFNWFLPTNGDSRHLTGNISTPHLRPSHLTHREPDVDYLIQIARAAEATGFNAALIPTGAACEDAWLIAAALAQHTEKLKFLVAFRPGLELPAYAAQKVAALQTFTGNRVLLNVVTGGDQDQQEAYGDFLEHDERYLRTAEFLQVVRQIWQGPGQEHSGAHYHIRNGGLTRPLSVPPDIYFGGASPAAEKVATGGAADVYLLWGETPDMVNERLQRVRSQAQQQNRTLRFGLRIHVIARETERQAWDEADRLWRALSPETIARAQRALRSGQSVGQARMQALNDGARGSSVRDLEIAPGLWSGIGLVRGGAGTALVGSYQQVADAIRKYHDLGIDTFIFSGYANLEEAWRVGENVLPRVQ